MVNIPLSLMLHSVMNCYAKSKLPDKAQRAEDLLLRMEEKYRNETDVTIKPNTIVYSTVLLCWATSNHSNAVVNAERLLQRMENLYSEGHIDVRPNEKCYSAVISSWAKSKNVDAAHRAESILRRMEYMYESGVRHVKCIYQHLSLFFHLCACASLVAFLLIIYLFYHFIHAVTHCRILSVAMQYWIAMPRVDYLIRHSAPLI